jgi:hypothetical protein
VDFNLLRDRLGTYRIFETEAAERYEHQCRLGLSQETK